MTCPVRQRSRHACAALAVLCCLGGDAKDNRAYAIAPDKSIHLTVSFGLGASAYVAGSFIDDRRWRFAFSLGVALSVGAAKEAWDATGQGEPSWSDMGYNLLGAGAGVALAWLLDRATTPNKHTVDGTSPRLLPPLHKQRSLQIAPPVDALQASKLKQCRIRR